MRVCVCLCLGGQGDIYHCHCSKGTPATGKAERLPCSAFVYVCFLPQSLFLSLLALQRLSRVQSQARPGARSAPMVLKHKEA